MQKTRSLRAPRHTAWAATGVMACVAFGGLGAIGAAPVSAAPTTVSVFGTRTPAHIEGGDSSAVELGMRFRPSRDGVVTGVRFYKSAQNTGVHTGTLWSNTGTRLAAVTFAAESGSGWQTATLSRPLAVRAGTTYVVSYHTNTGHYAADERFFDRATTSGPLTAPANSWSSTNSVYRYGASAFPNDTWHSTNYWVDVTFQPTVVGAAPAPTVTTPAPAPTTPTPTVTRPPAPTTPAPTTPAPTTPAPTTPAPTTPAPTTPAPTTPAPTTPAPTTPAPTTPAPTTPAPTTPAPTTPAPPAASSAWPDASNTGVPAGVTLSPSGDMTVSTAGAVIDAKDVRGSITVTAPNVVIKRSRFTGNGDIFAIQTKGSGSVRIEDCEFVGNYEAAAIAYDNWTMVRSEISGVPADGVKLGDNVVFQDNYLHDFTTAAGNHADGGQVQGGVVNTVIRHNNIALSTSQNAALFMAPDLGPSTNGPLTVENNLLAGGNFTLFEVDGNNGQYFINNITIRNNRFKRLSNYGPARVNVPVTWTGNVWDDNGTSVGY